MTDCAQLTDQELVSRLRSLARQARRCVAELVSHLLEFEQRGRPDESRSPNLFRYCTQELGFSEGFSFRLIRAAYCSKLYPRVLTMLDQGQIHLEAVALLNPYLEESTCDALLDEARGKSKREVEVIVSRLAPRKTEMDHVRHLGRPPEPAPATETSRDLFSAPSQAETAPAVNPGEIPTRKELTENASRVRFAFTGTELLYQRIERAKALLHHKYPAGHLEDILGEAIELLLDKKDPDRRIRRKAALERSPRATVVSVRGRYIPQEVKDAVWARDGGRCAFVRPGGSRCAETFGLEYDHIIPYVLGGTSASADNIRLLCAGHNRLRARRAFGGPTSGR